MMLNYNHGQVESEYQVGSLQKNQNNCDKNQKIACQKYNTLKIDVSLQNKTQTKKHNFKNFLKNVPPNIKCDITRYVDSNKSEEIYTSLALNKIKSVYSDRKIRNKAGPTELPLLKAQSKTSLYPSKDENTKPLTSIRNSFTTRNSVFSKPTASLINNSKSKFAEYSTIYKSSRKERNYQTKTLSSYSKFSSKFNLTLSSYLY